MSFHDLVGKNVRIVEIRGNASALARKYPNVARMSDEFAREAFAQMELTVGNEGVVTASYETGSVTVNFGKCELDIPGDCVEWDGVYIPIIVRRRLLNA